MSTFISRIRRIAAATISAGVASALAVVAAPAAHAAGVPNEVNIRLSAEDTAHMTNKSYWWTNEPASRSMVKFVEAGADLVLHYTVTDTNGSAVAGATLSLSTAGSAPFSGSVVQTTDANGAATFTLHSTADNSIAEPRPVAPSTMDYFDDFRGGFPEVKYDITPTVGASSEHIDRVWTHTVKTADAPSVKEANLYLSSDDAAHMTDKSYWWTNEPASRSLVKFVEAGSNLVLHYRATDASGNPIANTPMTLKTAAIERASFTGGLTETTDADGYATFTLHSTTDDANAESRPVAPSTLDYWDDSRGDTLNNFFSTYNFEPTIGYDIEHVDRVWTHTVKSPGPATPPAEVTIRVSAADAAHMTDKSYWWTNEPASRSLVKFVTAGTDFTVTYTVTDTASGAPVANVDLALKCLGGSASFATCQGGQKIVRRTNAQGEATFVLHNNTSDAAAEPRPVAPSSMDYWDDSRTVAAEAGFNFEPSVDAATQHIDRIWTHTVKAPASNVIPFANLYLVASSRAGMTDKSYWWTNEPASHSLVKFVAAGSTLVLKYRATDAQGAGIGHKTVTLNALPGGACFTGALAGETDAEGYVTFTLHNCTAAADAEPAPTAPSSMEYWDDSRVVSPDVKYDFIPTMGASVEHIDRVWTHTVKPDEVTIRLADADSASMTDKSYWWTNESASRSLVKFVTAGGTLVLHYQVTNSAGPVAGRAVTLNTADGGGCFTGSLTGTTDANGHVTFTLTNCTANEVAEPRPEAPSSMDYFDDSRSASPEIKFDFSPTAGASIEHIDRIWTHTVKQLPKSAPAAIGAIYTTAGDGSIDVSFDAPFNGNSEITGYAVTAKLYTGSGKVSKVKKFNLGGNETFFTYEGVTNGLTYSFVITASNALGTSPATESSKVTPGTGSAPSIDNITTANGKLTLEITPGDDGSAATKYFQYSLDGGSTWVTNRKFMGSSFTITKLTNGASYSVRVRPVNKFGAGAASDSYDASPIADAPSAPRISKVTTTSNSMTVYFKAGYNGGAEITDFEYSLDGGASWTSAGTTDSPLTIEGLDPLTSYSVSLRAVNSSGEGTASAPRNAKTRRG